MPLSHLELRLFVEELLAIREKVNLSLSKNDYHHLKKIIWTNRCLLFIGFGTAWIIPNPISMFAIGVALTGMWAIVAHHVMHGGYDNIKKIPKRYHSHTFARGFRRYIDWPDWIYPPAWAYEHNTLHHFYVNERLDPDQMSFRFVAKTSEKSKKKPKWRKLLKLFAKISFWKCHYYAYNTMKAWVEKKSYQQNGDYTAYAGKTYWHCVIPYITYHFLLLPLLFIPLGWKASLFVLINRFGAEIITNWHTFFIIVPNHTGSDLALQKNHFKTKEAFYLAQLTSTCNFRTGGFWCDYFHGYLNYQIEHHFFPNLPASQYAKWHPMIKALCYKYGLPYIQESVFIRTKKLFNIMLQKEVMAFSESLLQEKTSEEIASME